MHPPLVVALRGDDPAITTARPRLGRRRRSWTRSDGDATRRRVLVLADSGLRQAEIARRLRVDPSTVSRALAWYRDRHGVAP